MTDAPPHRPHVDDVVDSIETLRAHDVALYPVAASGTRDTTELLMRTGARVTGGQYLFLTNHSGIGNTHAKPHGNKYKVETLHEAMHRMIRGELGAAAKVEKAPPFEPVEPEVVEPSITREAPVPVVAELAPELPAASTYSSRVRESLMTHFGIASGLSLAMFFAMGLDTRGRRRRRR